MAKIEIRKQDIFAALSDYIPVFGSLAAGSPTYTNDPDDIQSLAAWTNGWASAVIPNGTITTITNPWGYAVTELDYIISWEATATWISEIVLPVPTAANVGRVVVIKILGTTSGGNVVRLSSNGNATIGGSAFVNLVQGNSVEVVSTGTAWTIATHYVDKSEPPSIEDFDAFFFLATRQIAYLMQAGVAEWNMDTEYQVGSLAQDTTGNIYLSVTGPNIGTEEIDIYDESRWSVMLSKKAVRNLAFTGNYQVSSSDFIISWEITATSSSGITLPAPTAQNVGRVIIIKILGSTASYPVVLSSPNSTRIDGSLTLDMVQYDVYEVVSFGTGWVRTTIGNY
jgi:hypothetical protein